MQIKSFKIIITLILIFLAHSLHLEIQQPYDPYKYYDSLQQKQIALKNDLNQIQNMFKDIDNSLESAADDPSKKLQILQQGLADQRDALISIQQYLNLPLNQRSCQCFNFTQQMKDKIQVQLDNVKSSIEEVEANTIQCSQCEFIIEIKKQIQQQKNYLKTMQDTLHAKCCNIYDIRFKDDLSQNNWKYGSQSPEDYQSTIRKIGASQDNILVKVCPKSTPYSMQNYTECINCDDPNQVFNLEIRKCQSCPTGEIFNYQKHKCQIVCPPGTFLNQKTNECEEIVPEFNVSSCPSDKPIWNPDNLGCTKCPRDQPFYDEKNKRCIPCPADYHYQQQLAQCVHKQCKPGEYFDQSSSSCHPKQHLEGSTSLCPIQTPYWDSSTLSCNSCPINKPRYNKLKGQCESCPQNMMYAQIYEQCVQKCSSGYILNPSTLQCINKQEPEQEQQIEGDVASMCPPEKPIWNSDSKSCSKCSQDKPFWDQQENRCQKCGKDSNWNQLTLQCQSKTPRCLQNQIFNYSLNKCVENQNIFNTAAICPPYKPYFNVDSKSCDKCPSEKPFYNSNDKQCQKTPLQNQQQQLSKQSPQKQGQTIGICPPNQVYDPLQQICKNTSDASDQKPDQLLQTKQPETAPNPQEQKSQKKAICPPQNPVWNQDILVCQKCPKGTVWNSLKNLCLSSQSYDKQDSQLSSSLPKQCPQGQQLNQQINQCQPCEKWEIYSLQTKSCKSICKQGQVYHSQISRCLGTVSYCPPGLIYDQNQLRCKCSQGQNYKYVQQDLKCQKVCAQNQFYDNIQKKCLSY